MIARLADVLREVGQALLDWRTSGGASGEWETTQFHAKADRWAHDLLTTRLSSLRPGWPIISEEDSSGQAFSGRGRHWIIDPIDGTASYAGGFAGYVTQAALMENQTPILAGVMAPHTGELFLAERGAGSFKDDQRLSVDRLESLTLIDNYPAPRGIAEALFADLGFSKYIESGSIGLKICRVADGTADGFFKNVIVRDWDLAAPHLVLAEAGGGLTDGTGNPITYGNTRRHDGLLATNDVLLAERILAWHRGRVAAEETVT